MGAVSLVCIPASMGTPLVASYPDVCAVCHADVWRSTRSLGLVVRVVCLVCALREESADGDVRRVFDETTSLRELVE